MRNEFSTAPPHFSWLAYVEHRDPVRVFIPQFEKILNCDLWYAVKREAALNPAGHPICQVPDKILDADAGEAQLGFADVIGIFSDDDEWGVEAEDARRPGSVLAGEGDVEGAGHVGRGELRGRTRIDDDGAFVLQVQDVGGGERDRRGEFGERGRAFAVEADFLREVFGRSGKVIGEEANEVVAGAGLQSVVGAFLLADGGEAFGAHLASAEGACAVGGKDAGVVGEGKKFLVQAAVEHLGELLGSVGSGEIGATHIADEERIAGEDGRRIRWDAIVQQDADAFDGVAGSLKEAEASTAARHSSPSWTAT